MNATRWLAGALSVMLVLAAIGCKKHAAPAEGANPPPEEGPTKEDIRKGIGKMLPSVQRHDASMDLRTIAQLYAADALGGSAPKKLEDLKGLDGRTAGLVKDGTYVVIWNASPNTPGTALIAYEKDVPKAGGMVADLTGAVRRMTALEFDSAPKAATR
jgi:hypothetical protein